jgi:hypothetical protein
MPLLKRKQGSNLWKGKGRVRPMNLYLSSSPTTISRCVQTQLIQCRSSVSVYNLLQMGDRDLWNHSERWIHWVLLGRHLLHQFQTQTLMKRLLSVAMWWTHAFLHIMNMNPTKIELRYKLLWSLGIASKAKTYASRCSWFETSRFLRNAENGSK